MRMNTQRILAALLSLVLLLALAPAGWAEGGGEAGAANEPVLEGSGDGGAVSLPAAGVVLTSNNSVSINLVPSDKVTAEDQTFANEIKLAKVEADLYLIAPAVADPNYDTYTYDFTGSPFVSLEDRIKDALKTDPATPTTREMMLKSFTPIAHQAADIVKTTEASTQNTPSATTESTISVTGLPAGMYLLLLRGNNLEKNETDNGYFATTKKEGGESAGSETPAEATTNTVTRALSDNYEFLFEPQLITLPTKIEGEEQAYNTTYSYNTAYGKWSENLYITAKPDWKPRNGDLKIKKVINNTVDNVGYAGTKATFAYRVVAHYKNKLVYDNICEITIPANESSKEVIIEDKIPVGAVVEVTEVYDGSRYEIKGSRIVITGDATGATLVINSSDTDPATIEFTNDNDGSPKEGYGILNTFTYNGSEWVWNGETDVQAEPEGGSEA